MSEDKSNAAKLAELAEANAGKLPLPGGAPHDGRVRTTPKSEAAIANAAQKFARALKRLAER